MNLLRFVVSLSVLLVFPFISDAQEPVRVPELPSVPVVDGSHDEVYSQGAQLVDFWDFSTSIASAVPAAKPMHAWLGHRDRVLYLYCECAEPEPGKIKTKVDFHDGPVWTDDCLELYIDPVGDRRSAFHFVLSAAGVTADLYNGGVAWNPDYEAAARVLDASWAGEWGIPFESLGVTGLEDIYAGKKWTFGLYREDYVSAAYSSWVPVNSAIVKTFETRSVFAEMHIVLDGEPAVYTLKGTPLRPSGKGSEEIVWQTKDPVYGELLSDEPRHIPNETGMFWLHPLYGSSVRSTAVQYGLEYSLEETANVFKDLDFHPIQQGRALEKQLKPNKKPSYPQAKFMYMANSHYAHGEQVPVTDSGFTILFFPENVEAYLREAEDILAKHKEAIWGVFAGDEVVNHQTNLLIDGLHRYDEKLTPYVEKIDADIKRKFGMSVYGLPESENDEEPYRWLATNSWIDEQTCLLIERLRTVVDRVAPEVKVMSDDPIAGFHPHDFAWRGKHCDLITHQTYPARTRLRQECAFIAKLLYDQSGKSVWPCVHAEHYGASYTPEQTAEVYSQIFRCGAEGIHYYPQDVVGIRRGLLNTHYCGLGAPDRWATMLSIFKRVHELPKVKVPEATTVGVLIEPSTIRAVSKAKAPTRDEYQNCFDILGPHAGSWFRFIHAGQMERGELDLKDYEALYVPMGKFFHPDRADDLLAYCNSGGTVISTDPEVWTYSATEAYGEVAQLKELGLAHKEGWTEAKALTILDNRHLPEVKAGTEIPFPLKTRSRRYDLDKGWVTLAAFDDRSPAIVRRELGKGGWIQFAFQPFEEASLSNEKIVALFASMQEYFGENIHQDIWRFTFPTVQGPKMPEGICLTGNAVHWEQNIPKQVGGEGVDEGTASWTLRPKGTAADTQPFSNCRLFDRRQGIAAKNDAKLTQALANWSCVWDGTDAFQLTLSWAEERDIDRIKIWFSGHMPSATIEAQTTNKGWIPAGRVSDRDVKTDIGLVEIRSQASRSTGVRIDLPERTGEFAIHEIEVWGSDR